MASTFSFPLFKPAEIVEQLRNWGIAPSDSLREEDAVNPQPGFVSEVLYLFLVTYVSDEPDEQVLDNPEHHMCALRLSWIYKRANAFLQSIRFQDLNLRDLLRADGPRVAYILSALINFLLFREEKINVLQPIVQEFATHEERHAELRAKIAELRKAKEDLLLKEQEEAPMVQQLEKEVNALRQRLYDYNSEQLSQEEILWKRNLEEKKAARDELKNLEKMAVQKVQEKTNTLEMYTKVSEKLAKHLTKISAVLEKSTSAKASEKDVKAHKEKISDQNLEIKALRNKAAEWQLKGLENEAKLKAKEKERDQRVGENKRKMNALKAEVELEHKCLEEKERKIKEKFEKGSELCPDLVAEAARKKVDKIYLKYNQVCEAAKMYLNGLDQSFDKTDEAAVM